MTGYRFERAFNGTLVAAGDPDTTQTLFGIGSSGGGAFAEHFRIYRWGVKGQIFQASGIHAFADVELCVCQTLAVPHFLNGSGAIDREVVGLETGIWTPINIDHDFGDAGRLFVMDSAAGAAQLIGLVAGPLQAPGVSLVGIFFLEWGNELSPQTQAFAPPGPL